MCDACGSAAWMRHEYDTLGRPYRETDASGSTVERTWNVRGYAYRLRNAATPSEVYQQITEHNARGQVTEELRGAATLSRSFHPQRGWLTGITTTAATTLQHLTYAHDLLGNLTQRRDLRANQVEDFAYDGLNRLTTATVKVGAAPAVTALGLSYDLLGNICSKNGQLYSYDGRDGCNASGTSATASPHAVTQIGSASYRYGARGELGYSQDAAGPASDRWFAYDGLQNLSLVLVGTLMAPSAELSLRYSPGGERYRREERIGSATTTTRSVGSVEFVTRPDGVIETRRHIGGVLIETRYSSGAPTAKRYLYPDGLGSLDVIANEAGTVHERLGFDGHGSRRNGDDWRIATPAYSPQTTPRGFTGHEHLDPFKLIHMNGRVYDPQMGRFIQADPILDAGIQGLNRYSYALNNPLTLTDPTGYSSWNRWLRTVAAIVITVYSGGSAAGASWGLWGASVTAGQAFAITVAGGFAAGAIQSGNVKGGLYGAFGAAAFYGVGTAFQNAGWAHTGRQLNSIGRVAKTVSHGMVGGVMSDLQGGKFGHGFLSAGATQAVSPQIDRIDSSNVGFSIQRTLAAAALGGSVSAATGGKFANGAVTAAFSRAFNDEITAHNASRRAALGMAATREMEKAAYGLRFKTLDQAEEFFYFLAEEPTRRLGLEFGVDAYEVLTSNGSMYEIKGFNSSVIFDEDGYGSGVNVGQNKDPLLRAYFHTHPANSSPGLSRSDYYIAINSEIDAYARMTNGARYTFSYQAYLNAGSPSREYLYRNQDKFSK